MTKKKQTKKKPYQKLPSTKLKLVFETLHTSWRDSRQLAKTVQFRRAGWCVAGITCDVLQ